MISSKFHRWRNPNRERKLRKPPSARHSGHRRSKLRRASPRDARLSTERLAPLVFRGHTHFVRVTLAVLLGFASLASGACFARERPTTGRAKLSRADGRSPSTPGPFRCTGRSEIFRSSRNRRFRSPPPTAPRASPTSCAAHSVAIAPSLRCSSLARYAAAPQPRNARLCTSAEVSADSANALGGAPEGADRSTV